MWTGFPSIFTNLPPESHIHKLATRPFSPIRHSQIWFGIFSYAGSECFELEMVLMWAGETDARRVVLDMVRAMAQSAKAA